jgi:hypothetical protein
MSLENLFILLSQDKCPPALRTFLEKVTDHNIFGKRREENNMKSQIGKKVHVATVIPFQPQDISIKGLNRVVIESIIEQGETK